VGKYTFIGKGYAKDGKKWTISDAWKGKNSTLIYSL
jgi:hypothetical protein